MCLLVASCKKEEGKHFYISDAFKRWTLFNKGSYWIYRNDSTLMMDSVFLKSDPQILEIPYSNTNLGASHEQISTSFSSSFYNSSDILVDPDNSEHFRVYIDNDFIFIPWALLAGSSDNFSSYPSLGDSYKLLSFDSVYYIGAVKFTNVVNTQAYDGFSRKRYTFWFAKDIGLIKLIGYNTNPDFSWNVIRFHIIH